MQIRLSLPNRFRPKEYDALTVLLRDDQMVIDLVRVNGHRLPDFGAGTMAFAGKVLIIVQNLPVPFDRRVWLEATTLQKPAIRLPSFVPKVNTARIKKVISVGKTSTFIAIPHRLMRRGHGYLFEFVYCWIMTAWLSLRVYRRHGFDVLHACNPPETYFCWRCATSCWESGCVFDHHDLSPEMYLAKGGKRNGALYRGLLWLEKLTFKSADVVITTNESHKAIAMQRGGVSEDRIFVWCAVGRILSDCRYCRRNRL